MRFIDRSQSRSQSRRKGLLADQRGGAQVEGAIVALFFAMMFAGFLWYQHLTHVNLAAVRTAGRDVWVPALTGCEDGSASAARGWVGGYRSIQREVAPLAANRLDDVTQDDVRTNASGRANRPAMFGGGAIDIERRGGTECNTKMTEGAIPWAGRVRELFCARYPAELKWAAGCSD